MNRTKTSPDVHEVTTPLDRPGRVVVPTDTVWDDFFASSGADLGERNQLPPQVREDL